MSRRLSFEIGGVRDDETVHLTVGNGCSSTTERSRTLGDPGEPLGHSPDDPGEPLGHSPDDPGEPLGHSPDDPGEPLGHSPDDPGEPLGHSPDDPGEPLGHQPDDPAGFRGGRRAINGANGRVDASYPLATGVPPLSERYSGFVVVRLSSLVAAARPGENLIDLARRLRLDGLRRVLRDFNTPPSPPAITRNQRGHCVCPVTLGNLERRAAGSDLPPIHSLSSYWRIDSRDLKLRRRWRRRLGRRDGFAHSLAELTRRLLHELNALSEVDLAYRELAATDPSVHVLDHVDEPDPNEFADSQLYLDAQPYGINARWAQARINDNPHKLALADLEQGWILDHEEFLSTLAKKSLLFGNNRNKMGSYRGDHGTAVVSELAGDADNGLGIVGIAPGVTKIMLASHYKTAVPPATNMQNDEPGPSNGHVADAIHALLDTRALEAGDILLLEVQRAGHPTEIDPLDFDAMDSGAIMVGASRAALPHDRAWFSNYGSRLDCFGWGEQVVAAGYGNYLNGDDDEIYTDSFSGTSSASPMIAGAAALVQSLYMQNAGPDGGDDRWKRLSPSQMRSLLSHPRSGTPQGPNVRGRIGVMPDLRAVVDRALGVVPQLYLRDHVGDTGETPNGGRTYCSPDVLLQDTSGGIVLTARVRNRGLKSAENVRATFYFAPRSTLLTPDRWTKAANESDLFAVPQGDTHEETTVKPTVAMTPTSEEGRALVAVVEYDGNDDYRDCLVPCHTSNFSWPRFLDVMRRQRTVAVCNMLAVQVNGAKMIPAPPAPGEEETPRGPLRFTVNGTPDAPRLFSFEILQQLPENVQVTLHAPLGLALDLSGGRLWSPERDSKGSDITKLILPRQPRLRLGSTRLPAAVDFDCWFSVSGAGLPNTGSKPGHCLAIRQLYRGEEVGRITWEFEKSKKLKKK
jgi:hypothetical protein